MADYVFDTSALVKRYHLERGSAEVRQLFADASSTHTISRLTAVELLSAFTIKARTNAISASEVFVMRARFRTDQSGRVFRVVPLRGRHYRLAEDLVGRYGLFEGLRTLDAIQLAVAIELRRQGRITHFVSSDTDLTRVAESEGFAVLNPEQP
jgi:predicted nucleic acid-binding protein